jgi:hypothetical protein
MASWALSVFGVVATFRQSSSARGRLRKRTLKQVNANVGLLDAWAYDGNGCLSLGRFYCGSCLWLRDSIGVFDSWAFAMTTSKPAGSCAFVDGQFTALENAKINILDWAFCTATQLMTW